MLGFAKPAFTDFVDGEEGVLAKTHRKEAYEGQGEVHQGELPRKNIHVKLCQPGSVKARSTNVQEAGTH